MRQLAIVAMFLGATATLALGARAQEAPKAAVASASGAAPAAKPKKAQLTRSEPFSLAQGEKRFRQNCGRCHVAPDKFPPRMMATVLRHMRVRATITDEDARLILWYMTR